MTSFVTFKLFLGHPVTKWNTLDLKYDKWSQDKYPSDREQGDKIIHYSRIKRSGDFVSSPRDPGITTREGRTFESLTPYTRSQYRPVYFGGAYKGRILGSTLGADVKWPSPKYFRGNSPLYKARKKVSERIFFDNNGGGSSSSYGTPNCILMAYLSWLYLKDNVH